MNLVGKMQLKKINLLNQHNVSFFLSKRPQWNTVHEIIVSMWSITVFTQPNLEKDPDYNVPPQEIFRVPKPGTVNWDQSVEDHRSIFDATMDRLRQRTNQRRVLTKPVFQDFDR
jgi:hypothetical protein